MKFIDLDAQYRTIHTQINTHIQQVLEHGQFILGPEVAELEQKLAKRLDVAHCISTSSGTSALQIALMALGVGPGDEVITTPFSFFATVEMILLLGAKPVFVDIDPLTYTLDPQLLAPAITRKTKAILAVSLFGQCADFQTINAIARAANIPVIEDAAQSLGATHHQRPSGNLTPLACTSFFPSKPLGCYGDGGACFTNDEGLAKKMRLIMNHGQAARYQHVCVGLNARFDTLQAAILLAKLNIFDEELTKRQALAACYDHHLKGCVEIPYIASFNQSVYAQYTIQVNQRESVQKVLQERGIPTVVHYPQALHQLPVVNQADRALPVAELLSKRVLSLPFHPYLTEESIANIAENLIDVIEVNSAIS